MKKNKPGAAIPGPAKDGEKKNANGVVQPGGGPASTDVKEEVSPDRAGEGDSVSALENQLLNQAFNPSYDTDVPIKGISLDDRDDDGEKLEESGLAENLFGGDLDDELIREEDEETEGEDPQQ